MIELESLLDQCKLIVFRRNIISLLLGRYRDRFLLNLNYLENLAINYRKTELLIVFGIHYLNLGLRSSGNLYEHNASKLLRTSQINPPYWKNIIFFIHYSFQLKFSELPEISYFLLCYSGPIGDFSSALHNNICKIS